MKQSKSLMGDAAFVDVSRLGLLIKLDLPSFLTWALKPTKC